jgi:hypothetical protein
MDNIIKSCTPQAPKGVIYGAPGVGKTTFAAGAANALILDCENGAGNIPCERTPYLGKWADIVAWLDAMEKDAHKVKVMAIDSIDWLVRRAEEHVSGAGAGKLDQTLARSHGGYGNGKQVLRNYIYADLLPRLDRINARGIAVILLGHARRVDIIDVDGISTEKSAPDLPDDVLSTIIEWSDFVGVARKNPDGARSLTMEDGPRAVAKNRYGITAPVAFDWKSFESAVVAGISAKQKKG